jgi:predicted nucleic acid-binding protein
MYLFDASSIVNLVKKGVVRVFAYGATIDLALYEALNAIWKESRLLKRIDEKTALEYVNVLSMIFKVIRKTSIEGSEDEVFKLALREGLTIYDASYLYLAIRDGLTLVTDDKRLLDKASRYVNAMHSSELARLQGSTA